MEQSQALRSILITFKGGTAVLPNSSVVEVLPFATPLRMENAPPWVVGAILWKSLTIPIVSLERLVFRTDPGAGAHSRIIVVSALGSNPRLRDFGFLGTEAPQLMDLERNDIALHKTGEVAMPGVACRVTVKGHEAVIPDMTAIESVLSRLVKA